MKPEVINGFVIECIGAAPADLQVKADILAVQAVLTIFKDGGRDVSCPFLTVGRCRKFEEQHGTSKCVHLSPQHS